MATITCGWCKDRCHMSMWGEVKVADSAWPHGDDRFICDAAFACDGCGRISVATWRAHHDPRDATYRDGSWQPGPGPYDEARWSPPGGHQQSFPDVPAEIGQAAQEAWTCHMSSAHRGAVLLARAVVESTAKAKGITKGLLEQKIDSMAAANLIRPAVAEQAHEVRHLGNSTAHGDLGVSVLPEDAEEVLHLMGEVLNEVWQSPAKAARLAARRQAALTPKKNR